MKMWLKTVLCSALAAAAVMLSGCGDNSITGMVSKDGTALNCGDQNAHVMAMEGPDVKVQFSNSTLIWQDNAMYFLSKQNELLKFTIKDKKLVTGENNGVIAQNVRALSGTDGKRLYFKTKDQALKYIEDGKEYETGFKDYGWFVPAEDGKHGVVWFNSGQIYIVGVDNGKVSPAKEPLVPDPPFSGATWCAIKDNTIYTDGREKGADRKFENITRMDLEGKVLNTYGPYKESALYYAVTKDYLCIYSRGEDGVRVYRLRDGSFVGSLTKNDIKMKGGAYGIYALEKNTIALVTDYEGLHLCLIALS